MLTAFLTGQITDKQLDEIRAAAPGADLRYFATREELEARIEEAEIVAGRVGPAALARAERLRWVQSWAAGPDQLMYPEMLASDVLCTSAKGNGAIPLAEHAIMLMLMLNRDALRWVRDQDAHRWQHRPHGELNGLTCGIIGLGHSGQDLVLKCQAFRHARARHPPHAAANPECGRDVHPRPPERVSGASDFVVVTAPRTPETLGMLGEAQFRAMKPTAHYVCFSRGGIADDAALLRALQEGWIASAGLDAHDQEPLPAASPFWDLPNTIITPHNGAPPPATRQRGIDSSWRTCAATRPENRSTTSSTRRRGTDEA